MSNPKWTEVTDPTTLKAGDKIRVESPQVVIEAALSTFAVEDSDEEWSLQLVPLDNYLYVPKDTTKFFLAEPAFAPLNRALEPGEVVEDSIGRRYTLNPLNPRLVIDSLSGMPGTEEFIYMYVRPVR